MDDGRAGVVSATAPDDVPAAAMDLRGKVVGGLGWKLATQVVTQGSRFVVAILLAHLLTPHEFGLAAMALVFVALAPLFTDLSLGAALVQRPSITEEDRCTAFWTTLASSAATTVAGIAAAPLVADFFHNPAVAPLFAVTSITFTLSGASATHFALLNRELQFRSLQIREMIAIVSASSVGLTIAFAGGGAWAIVLQLVVADAVSSVLVWRFSPWRPRLMFSFASLRYLAPFGLKTLSSRFLAYLRLNMDTLLVGRYVGSHALGIYTISYTLMFAPIINITQPVQQVLFPAFARLQGDPERVSRVWLRGNRLLVALTLPAFVGMALIAGDFVPVVLGTRWNDAVPVVHLLCLAGVALSLEQLNVSVLQGLGRAGTLLRYMLASTTLVVISFVVGVRWGILGVAAAYVAATAALAPIYAWITTRATGVSLRQFAGAVSGVFQATLVMALVVFGLRMLLLQTNLPTGLRLAALIVVGVAVYVASVWWRAPTVIAELRDLRKRQGVDA